MKNCGNGMPALPAMGPDMKRNPGTKRAIKTPYGP